MALGADGPDRTPRRRSGHRRRRDLASQRGPPPGAPARRPHARATCRASCSWRSTAWPTTSCGARCATATRRRSRTGCARAPTSCAVGDRLVLPDRRLPGRAAPRRQPRHARISLVGEGPRRGDRDQPPERRRGDRAPPFRRQRAAARRRRQPGQHPLRRRHALDAHDEHGADRRRPIGRDYSAYFARPYAVARTVCWPSSTSSASARRRPAARDDVARASPRRHLRGSCAPGPPWFSSTSRSRPWSATSSPGGPSSTRRSWPTTRSPTTRGSSARTRWPPARRRPPDRPRRSAPADAPRPYRLVVLSDHGQSQGDTFLDRYGMTLEEVVPPAARRPSTRRRAATTTRWPT